MIQIKLQVDIEFNSPEPGVDRLSDMMNTLAKNVQGAIEDMEDLYLGLVEDEKINSIEVSPIDSPP